MCALNRSLEILFKCFLPIGTPANYTRLECVFTIFYTLFECNFWPYITDQTFWLLRNDYRICGECRDLKLTVVSEYYEAMETYSRIGLLRSYGNLQSYWTTRKLWKLTVVLDYYEVGETYSRIGLLRVYGNLLSYWTTTSPWKLTVVLTHHFLK